MYRMVRESGIPKFIKLLIYILLTVTCIYWIGYFTYKILETVRICINGITKEKGRWWFFLLCCVMIFVAVCIAMGWNPALELWEKSKVIFEEFRNELAEIIRVG